MALKDKVFQFIAKKQLFGTSYDEIMTKFYKENVNALTFKNKVKNAVEELIKDGKINIENNIVTNAVTKSNIDQKFFIGTFRQKGTFGKVNTTINGVTKEYFVSKYSTNKAPDNSLVQFSVVRKGHEEFATVKKVLKVENTIVTGFVTTKNNKLIFVPDDTRFTTPLKVMTYGITKPINNKKVWVKLNEQEYIYALPNSTASIFSDEQILGNLDNPLTHLQSYLTKNQISTTFSQEVTKELEEISEIIPEEEYKIRKDYRDKMFVTIDPKTTKDMDDAVYAEKVFNKNGDFLFYDVFVAIADVSHYVKSGTELDRDAHKRGNSFYPADCVFPMFDEKLSNKICSLNPNEDKLAIVTKIRLNREGNIIAYDFEKSIINSKHKFSYEEVSDLHHNERETLDQFSNFKELVENLYEVERITTKFGKKKGRLSIKSYEPTIMLDENRTGIADIINNNMLDSHKVVENIMVLNNIVVAQFLNTLGVSHLLRVHDYPETEMFNSLQAQLEFLKIPMSSAKTQKTYANIISYIENHKLEKLISTLLVRSMQKAKYDTNTQIGHFALATSGYSHFTSPIRRYADLAEHRILFKALDLMNKMVKEEKINVQDKTLEQIGRQVAHKHSLKFKQLTDSGLLLQLATHLNSCEQKAYDLESMANKICFALYMQNFVGKKFKGYVSHVGKAGATVTIENKKDSKHSNIIEVLIPTTDYSHLENKNPHETPNENKIALGEPLEFVISSVDVLKHTVYATQNIEKFNKMNEDNIQKVKTSDIIQEQ